VLPLDFTWTAPEACPTQAQVVQQLNQAVEAGGKELPPLTARAVVTQEGATWRLDLTTEMDGRRGTRVLEADSCEGLARAATLVLALTLGEGLERRRQAEAEAHAKKPEPAPREPAPLPPPPTREPTWATLWVAAAVGTDPLGATGPAVALGVGLQPSLLRFGARLEATFPRSTPFAGSGGDVQSFSFAADLEGCLAPKVGSLVLGACANAGVTVLEATGQGTARDGHATIPLYGVGPSVSADWLLGKHAFLHLGLVSRFFLVRPELVVEDLPEAKRVALASLSAQLGAGVRW
jgi:hypothetical protein